MTPARRGRHLHWNGRGAVVAFTSKEMVAPHETKEDGMGWCQVAAPCTHVSWTNLADCCKYEKRTSYPIDPIDPIP